jgi:hypothetical protein
MVFADGKAAFGTAGEIGFNLIATVHAHHSFCNNLVIFTFRVARKSILHSAVIARYCFSRIATATIVTNQHGSLVLCGQYLSPKLKWCV